MDKKDIDVVLIGAGAMSTCLGMLLKQLDPTLKIIMVERLDGVGKESTASHNNAGTGHAAYCELNYTPLQEDGSIDISKALSINEAFELSLQFWSYCVENGSLPDPSRFINSVPHQSFVWGEDNVEYLRKRYEVMREHPMFAEMEFSDDPAVISEWLPLVMENRDPNEKVAATKIAHGSDVNFGRIARAFARHLREQDDFDLRLNVNVTDLEKQDDGRWKVKIEDLNLEQREPIYTKFVFLGLGGGALPLLQKSDIPEADGYGGFPVSGQWLICRRPDIVAKHNAKVYGKAAVGSPPMSVPHLDKRVLEDGNALLFGPFAGFTTKFLVHGSKFDLIKSTTFDNILPLTIAGFRNFDLTKYLVKESRKTHAERMESLRHYFPDAKADDWVFAEAGQRVQIIKKDKDKGGKLEFGTEVVSSADGSISALLGASPGASVTVKAMLEVLESCFSERMASDEWQAKLQEMIPSYKKSLIDDPKLLKSVRSRTLKTLKLGDS
jgi:malate dehydrogenase (quinone)